MTKIIFLDIDGVLNSENYFDKTNDCDEYTDINQEKVKLLKEIVDRTGAEIVLSSTWRTLGHTMEEEKEHPKYVYLVNSLSKFGLEIKSHTPYLENNRPKEIKAWLDIHENKDDIRFVSLDDDFFKFQYDKYGIGDCLVKTSFYGSENEFQRKHVEEAVRILNGE